MKRTQNSATISEKRQVGKKKRIQGISTYTPFGKTQVNTNKMQVHSIN